MRLTELNYWKSLINIGLTKVLVLKILSSGSQPWVRDIEGIEIDYQRLLCSHIRDDLPHSQGTDTTWLCNNQRREAAQGCAEETGLYPYAFRG